MDNKPKNKNSYRKDVKCKKKSYRSRDDDGERKSYRPRDDDGERKSYRPRRDKSDGERKSYRPRRDESDSDSDGEKKSYRPRRNDSDSDGERKSYRPRRDENETKKIKIKPEPINKDITNIQLFCREVVQNDNSSLLLNTNLKLSNNNFWIHSIINTYCQYPYFNDDESIEDKSWMMVISNFMFKNSEKMYNDFKHKLMYLCLKFKIKQENLGSASDDEDDDEDESFIEKLKDLYTYTFIDMYYLYHKRNDDYGCFENNEVKTSAFMNVVSIHFIVKQYLKQTLEKEPVAPSKKRIERILKHFK